MTKKISEERLYRISSLTYRLALGTFIVLSIAGQFLTLSGDVRSDFCNTDYLVFIIAVIAGIVLTILPDIDRRHALVRTMLRYITVIFVLATAIFGLYGLYDDLRNYDFSADDTIVAVIIILFIVICTLLLKGLIKDKI